MPALARRRLLAGAALLPLYLAGCANLTLSQLQSDVQLVAAGLAGILQDLTAAGVEISPSTLASLTSELATLESDASAIVAALTPGQSLVMDFVDAVDAAALLLTPFFPAAEAIASTVEAAAALAQFVLQEAGVLAAIPAVGMTAAQARLILRAAVARRAAAAR